MNTNPLTVQRRTFIRPMRWATLEQLEYMLAELAEELEQVHESVIGAAARRNGYVEVQREINWRLRTGLAPAPRGRNRRNRVAARAQGRAPEGSESLAFIGRGSLKSRLGAQA
ncbi:hypothetical protein [Haliea salexigens]|uniref:hypothetical protein n=1 Tax=Haliea salexigens TaxID=287487 RepID=UPI000557D0F5|nr:hypothetical protein [Haliea salexigens]